MSVFDTTAQELGFALDAAQQRAAEVLADSDRNVYLWGPVGRGKSWLMATYFAAVPTDRKKRIHFHEFFRDLHLAIRRHRKIEYMLRCETRDWAGRTTGDRLCPEIRLAIALLDVGK